MSKPRPQASQGSNAKKGQAWCYLNLWWICRFFLKPPHLPEEVESSNIPHLFRKVFTAVLPPNSSSSSSLSSSTSSESGGRRDSEVGLYKNDCIRQFTNTALQTYVDQVCSKSHSKVVVQNTFTQSKFVPELTGNENLKCNVEHMSVEPGRWRSHYGLRSRQWVCQTRWALLNTKVSWKLFLDVKSNHFFI